MIIKYDKARAICYWIAKHLGIASHLMYGQRNGKTQVLEATFLIPQKIYVYERELDDDRYIDWEKVCGIQLYPFNKNWLKYTETEFGWDSLYREYIRQRVERKV